MNSQQQLQQQQQQQHNTNTTTTNNETELMILRAIAISSSITLTINNGQPISSNDRQIAFQVLTDFRTYDQRVQISINWLKRTDFIILFNEDITIPTKLYALDIIYDFIKIHYSTLSNHERYTIRSTIITTSKQYSSIVMINNTNTNTNTNNTNTNANAQQQQQQQHQQARIIANKLAILLAAFIVRDFPQRWTTLMDDIFRPIQQGGLWCNPTSSSSPSSADNNNNTTTDNDDHNSVKYTMGVKICLEALKLVAEDCTDSDFNAKISTKRRNDILIGLNEVSSHFLPQIFRLLEHITILTQAKANLHQMRTYLVQQQQQQTNNTTTNTTINSSIMTPEQWTAYQIEQDKVLQIGYIIADTLSTVEKFCRSMPIDWILNPQYDMSTAFYHLLREPTCNIQILAIECIEQLTLRGKYTDRQWNQMIVDLPIAIGHANQQFQLEQEYATFEKTLLLLQQQKIINLQQQQQQQQQSTSSSSNPQDQQQQQQQQSQQQQQQSQQLPSNHLPDLTAIIEDPLTVQFEYHRLLSRMLANVISSHVHYITTDNNILGTKKGNKNNNNNNNTSFSNYLRLLVDMLRHPSGRLCGEQINMWMTLLRDPRIPKSRILQPYIEQILDCYIDHVTRIRWEDVENQIHVHTNVMEASWDDEEEYEIWIGDFRSRASQLFKFIGNAEPEIASRVISTRICGLIANHGNGEPRDHLYIPNQQLTQKSEAVRLFEGAIQPMETVLCGLPSWSVQQESLSVSSSSNKQRQRQRQQQRQGGGGGKEQYGPERDNTRIYVRRCLSELAQTIVLQWNPQYVWLKFRRAQFLDSLKHYWKHDPTTLLQGIDSLLGYLRAPDEWSRITDKDGSIRLSDEMIGLRKKSSIALVTIAKYVPHHLVPWISQLSEATRSLLSSDDILPTNRMHMYEFLSCVATAVDDPTLRANFISDVLADAIQTLESQEAQQALSSVENFLSFLGITQAIEFPTSVTDPTNVKTVTMRFMRLFSAFNQLLSVGKRCHEAALKRPNGGIPSSSSSSSFGTTATPKPSLPSSSSSQHDNNNSSSLTIPDVSSFPDEGPISIRDLSINDPFVHLWPRILPSLLKAIDILLRIWRPEHQAILLRHNIQRYALAISDDDAYLSRRNDCTTGGVFGEGGTAGSIIPGTDRRDLNLAPRWAGWFTELRNGCFQLLGLLCLQRVPFAPEFSELYPQLVTTVVDTQNLRAMDHRHFTQYLKQFMENLLLSCPATMYVTHVAPILGPVLEHTLYRLEKTWLPILGSGDTAAALCKPMFTSDCEAAAALASRGGEDWFTSFYARSGLFVGDLDAVTAEAAVEKGRVEISRNFSDVVQCALGLKGDWALVLANIAKGEQAKHDPSKLTKGPSSKVTEGLINADGTRRGENQAAIDARKLLRISAMCHFLFLEHEQIAGSLTLAVIQCLTYPDAYTCRRMTRICHRILETVAWYPRYTDLIGNRMLSVAAKNIVTEPKWMVGIEWDMINVVRDIFGRLVLGQILQPGGQGAGQQQPPASNNNSNNNIFEQAKTADRPLQGGGILTTPSDLPRQVLASLPGIDRSIVDRLEKDLTRKKSARDQRDCIRDFLRVAADNSKKQQDHTWNLNNTIGNNGGRFGVGVGGGGGGGFGNITGGSGSGAASGLLDRAVEEESLLHNATLKATVGDIPEKLVTHSMMVKKASKKRQSNQDKNKIQGLAAFQL